MLQNIPEIGGQNLDGNPLDRGVILEYWYEHWPPLNLLSGGGYRPSFMQAFPWVHRQCFQCGHSPDILRIVICSAWFHFSGIQWNRPMFTLVIGDSGRHFTPIVVISTVQFYCVPMKQNQAEQLTMRSLSRE